MNQPRKCPKHLFLKVFPPPPPPPHPALHLAHDLAVILNREKDDADHLEM